MHYFETSKRYHVGIEFLSKLVKVDPEIGSMIARNLIEAGQEHSAVKLLHRCIVEIPLKSSTLLKVQGDFLWKMKRRADLAVEVYKYAVDIAPSDSDAWLRLAGVYAEMQEFSKALLTLNSCPMFLPVQGKMMVTWNI